MSPISPSVPQIELAPLKEHSGLMTANAAIPDAPVTPEHLAALPFPMFAQTVVSLLERLGYQEVRLIKPMHRRGKGRNAHGGFDIEAYLPAPLTRSLIVCQLKQYRDSVPRNFVDELRGAMLRVGASQGLLATTSSFSFAALEAMQSGQHIAPVRLLAGRELTELLHKHAVTLPAVPSTADENRRVGKPLAQKAAPMPDGANGSNPPECRSAAPSPGRPELHVVIFLGAASSGHRPPAVTERPERPSEPATLPPRRKRRNVSP